MPLSEIYTNGAGSDTVKQHVRAIQRVVATLQEQPDESLSLQELAEIAMMSPSHLDRVFRSVIGVPPRRYLSAVRLDAAKRLLVTTPLSVLDVCLEVGYSSLGSFSSRFSQMVGLPPSEFRRLVDQDCQGLRETVRAAGRLRAGRELAGRMLFGRVRAPDGMEDAIFVGLFGSAIPEGPPLACTVLQGPGDFRIRTPNGVKKVYPFAVALNWSEGWKSLLLHESVLQAGPGHEDAWSLRDDEPTGPVELDLAPPHDLQPPILIAIPELIRRWMPR